ncbi:MAG: UDP-3-O-acyl-N-acetylglucosamine deacetylase [Deltaproteobacteria bacterium]|nr:UDP-3-O-acyl-N-acetylglucosamine deacetylase [Deltaproteobacteria bacterium]
MCPNRPARTQAREGRSETVSGTSLATTIAGPGWNIATVEHLVSALVGMGVDNAVVEVDGEEIPIMDGSAAPFAHLIDAVGLKRQSKLRRYLVVTRPTVIREAGKLAALYPHDGFRVEYEIDFEHPAIKKQRIAFDLTPKNYREEIAPARTFGFLAEINTLKANGFAAGATSATPLCSASIRSSTRAGCVSRMSLCATRCSTPSATCISWGCRSWDASSPIVPVTV